MFFQQIRCHDSNSAKLLVILLRENDPLNVKKKENLFFLQKNSFAKPLNIRPNNEKNSQIIFLNNIKEINPIAF